MEINQKASKKPLINYLIKLICFISIYYTVEIKSNNKINIFNKNKSIKSKFLLSIPNLTEYSMVRFVDYEFLDFNSLKVFRIFRKKYFTLSNLNFDYNKENNISTLEYNFELFDENKNLFEPNNFSKPLKFKCLFKGKMYNANITNLNNNNFNCFNEFYKYDISKPIIFGVYITNKDAYLKVLFNLTNILERNK